MAPVKLFITGATGFIGGSILDKFLEAHPEIDISALMRSTSEAFASKYPTVKIIKGTFDDFDIIASAAEASDIILHAGDMDHEGCVNAILHGLSRRTEKSFLIHLTGTACISDELQQTWDGKSNPRKWDDIRDIDAICTLPAEAIHATVDQRIMNANSDLIKTVCICPPDIYGQSSASSGRSTFLVPKYVENLLKYKEAFYLGAGKNMRGVVHITDVVDLFALILDEYLAGGDRLDYGKEGFYFASTDEVVWKDVADAINKIGQEQGWLPSGTKTVSWTREQLATVVPEWPRFPLYIWGSNSRAEPSRAKRLGWKPDGPSFYDTLAEDCQIAANNALGK